MAEQQMTLFKRKSDQLLAEAIRFEGMGFDARGAGDTNAAERMFIERDLTLAEALYYERHGD